MTTFLCGSVYALYDTGLWSWTTFIMMGLAVLFVDMGTTGFNSYYDYISGTDNQIYNLERDKVLVHENVPPNTALAISLTLFALAGILGLVLASRTSWWLIVAGGACMVVGYTYTGGPFPISRTPFGEVFAGGFLGTVLFTLSYFVLTKTVNIGAVAASIPLTLLIAKILSVNNTCDRIADEIAGRKTMVILLGADKAKFLLMGELAAAYACACLLIFLNILPWHTGPLLVIAAVFSVRKFQAMLRRGFSLETKGPSMNDVSQLFLAAGASLCIGCLVAFIIR